LVVTTRGLVRDYGGGAGLQGVDVAVPRHGVYGLVGLNGAGKTTLLAMLAGLRRPDAGEIWIDPAARPVALCPDAPVFEPWLTAAEVLAQSCGLARASAESNAARLDAIGSVLADVGLGDAVRRRVGGFSRGMTQRLGLAAALILEPRVLLLDEPTSALDPAGRVGFLELIERLAIDRAVIFSSHILADVQRIADEVGVLDHGRLLFQGPTQALIDAHRRPIWEVRLRGSTAALATALRRTEWVTAVEPGPRDSLRVEGVSRAAGEAGLPEALAAANVGLVSVNPVDADLETAFLGLTQRAAPAGMDA
jgi:ABC-2 type transport system ATP-binding protein